MKAQIVTVRLFAVLRERAGTAEVPVAIEEGWTVGQVVTRVFEQYPQLRSFDAYLRTAVNARYAERGATVTDGDELAFISPVSGG